MQIQNMAIKVGRTINIGENEFKSLEVGMEIIFEKEDNVEQQYFSLKRSLESQLDSWEHEARSQSINGNIIGQPPSLITANATKNDINLNPIKINDSQLENGLKSNDKPKSGNGTSLICPDCKEAMVQKEGKGYFVCSKHWGYPDMIQKGKVREKKF